ncbi:MAG: acetate--CoA ligase family protein [Anaerolineae bacterium]
MDLYKLFDAQSICVIGASAKEGSFGGTVLKNLVDYGYPGQLFGVHPKNTEAFGVPCFPSLTDIRQVPDTIALAVANHHLLGYLEEAGELGVGAAVVFGDPTVGAGRDPELEGQIAQVAKDYDMAVLGANGMGYYALPNGIVISGYPVDPQKKSGSVALITHSGTIFDSMTQNNRDVDFNYVISAGNETCLTAADYLDFVLDDPTTKAVAMYLETVRDPVLFVAALQKALEKKIPIIALKTGLSERGQLMAQAHTGALAGGAEAYAALFEKYGVRQCFTLDEMMDTVELFSMIQRLPTPNVSALMESGGERSMLVDIAADVGVELTTFNASTDQRLTAILEDGVEPDNPLDAFGSGHNVQDTYRDCLLAMDADPGTGLLCLAVDLARDSYLSHNYVNGAMEALPKITKPFAGLVNLTAGAHDGLMAKLRAKGVPVLMGTETGMKAIRHLAEFSAFANRDQTIETAKRSGKQIKDLGKSPIGEYEAKQLLAGYGLPVPPERLVHSADDAAAFAHTIGFPVVLKTAAEGLLHKSEADGIRLNLQDGPTVRAAYADVSGRLGSAVLIQPMADLNAGVEMLLGMKNDPQFGPLLVIGLGGIFVEIFKDAVTVLPPLTRDKAAEVLQRLKGFPLLDGARGREKVDVEGLIDTILAFDQFVADYGDQLDEVDINPLVVSANGCVVVDGLLVPKTS